MDLYLVTYQQGSRFPYDATIQPVHNLEVGNKNPVEDHVYLFNSKTSNVKSVIVKSDLGEEKFSRWLEICQKNDLIASYFYVRYKQDNPKCCSGTFAVDEVDKFNSMQEMTTLQNSELKLLLDKRSFDNSLDMLEYEFKSMVGLNNVKDDLQQLYYHLEVLKERKKHNLPDDPISLHAVFKGAPGTGKTTIARIYGKLYKELGILKKGHLVELDRSDLVGQYVGHTEAHTKEKLEEALDGILFIDEAYSLKSEDDSNDYGKIAMEIILKFMEDNRDRISVIVAGYDEKMDKFLDSNEGLRSRFTNFYNFKNYTNQELTEIFDIMMRKEEYEYSSSIRGHMVEFFRQLKENSNPSSFGNAREVRNVCGDLKKIQAKRIYSSKDFKNKGKQLLVKITKNDIENLYSRHGFKLEKSNRLRGK